MNPPLPETAESPATISSTELKRQLLASAHQLGFAACRVASASAPLHLKEFTDWVDAGAAGEMAYLHRAQEKRADPKEILPGARSIIVLATNYWQGTAPTQEADGPSKGKIARYAWGDDYHDVIAKKLEQINALLARFGGRQKCYVDTGPVLERDHAAAAGVGWHGKSTMLIDSRLGAWFFLSEILTTLELPRDPPTPARCGTCSRCITACPTGAITSPHRLDARLCISYLTIEHKSAIPLEMRPLIGNRIFGCDDCLDACPWNRFAKTSRESAFQARPETSRMALRDYLSLSDDEFRQLFRNSPIKRIKRRGFLRNVCVALGNVGTTDDLPALRRAALDEEPLIAEHARWAVDRITAAQADCKFLNPTSSQLPSYQ